MENLMINETKQRKLFEFLKWIDEVSENSNHRIVFKEGAIKHLKHHINNSINMRRIQKNIEYIIDDPRNIKGQAPNVI